ncbi:MerR family transcriptional regulator [Ruegeria pomeroyi]|nr:MerR family transcriptional regulator [Ruegeria pomeroyi]MCE8519527.1 MerR family transcriptional regulator [Ruegeria pomeroyi]MCE8528244.1 MerR family transcriptional regulator [Ruegeria pomeroyi]MCE8531927.1 MerR family transcriptional regulator [Ruegeria pomeroyi]MCE8555214.1 MerR family transcriptional regulator [Ruegeria pomeroyi]
MSKSPDAFRTISEVAEWLGVQAHVLRFWESKFSQVKPVKRAGGRRYYRPADMQLLGGIKKLLHDDGMTIKGVQKLLREQGVAHVSGQSQDLEDSASPSPQSGGNVVRFNAQPSDRDSAIQFDMDLGEPVPTEVLQKIVADSSPAPSEDDEEDETPGDVEILSAPEPAVDPVQNKTPEDAVEDTPPQEADAPPRPLAIEVADIPADDDIEAEPGLLTALAEIHDLPAAAQSGILPLATKLQSWLDRQAG